MRFQRQLEVSQFGLTPDETSCFVRRRFPGAGSTVFSGGNSVRKPVGPNLKHVDRL